MLLSADAALLPASRQRLGASCQRLSAHAMLLGASAMPLSVSARSFSASATLFGVGAAWFDVDARRLAASRLFASRSFLGMPPPLLPGRRPQDARDGGCSCSGEKSLGQGGLMAPLQRVRFHHR